MRSTGWAAGGTAFQRTAVAARTSRRRAREPRMPARTTPTAAAVMTTVPAPAAQREAIAPTKKRSDAATAGHRHRRLVRAIQLAETVKPTAASAANRYQALPRVKATKRATTPASTTSASAASTRARTGGDSRAADTTGDGRPSAPFPARRQENDGDRRRGQGQDAQRRHAPTGTPRRWLDPLRGHHRSPHVVDGQASECVRDRSGPLPPERSAQTGTSPLIVTRWMTRCWSPKSPTTECWVTRLSQKPRSPLVQW